MAVQKFRTLEEMNDAPVLTRTGDDFERFLRHCARYWALGPRSYPRGVYKFRTIEEAQQARGRHPLPAATAGAPGPDDGEF